jgi:hypothetical protein
MDFIVSTVSGFSWLIFIFAGIISILSFGEKVASVMEKEEIVEWLKFASMFGFVFGILALIASAFNLIGPHLKEPVVGNQTNWDSVVIGLAIGSALALKPIKDLKWASLVSLSGGIGVMILIWILYPSSPSFLLIGSGLVALLILFLALKFIEDFYLLISSIVTSPPVSVGLGSIALIEGLLLLFNSSLLAILTSF